MLKHILYPRQNNNACLRGDYSCSFNAMPLYLNIKRDRCEDKYTFTIYTFGFLLTFQFRMNLFESLLGPG